MRIETLDDFGNVVESSEVADRTEDPTVFCEIEDNDPRGHAGPVCRWTSKTDGTVQLCEAHIDESPFHRIAK